MEEKRDEKDVLNPKGEKIEIGGRVFYARPLVFSQYERLFDYIIEWFKAFAEIDPDYDFAESDPKRLLRALPLVLRATSTIIEFICLGISIDVDDKEEVKKIKDSMTLIEMSKAIPAIVRQNRISESVSNLLEALLPKAKGEVGAK